MEFKTVKKVALQIDENKGMLFGMFNVAGNLGHSMSKEQLIDIIMELDWCVTRNVKIETYNDITRETLEQLEENETFESEEN